MLRQVHADDAHAPFAWDLLEKALQSLLRAPQRDVVDLVPGQITKGRGVAVLASEEMLVDPQHPRAVRVHPLAHLDRQVLLVPALDRRAPQLLPSRQRPLRDPLLVHPHDLPSKGLRRTPSNPDSRKALVEEAFAT